MLTLCWRAVSQLPITRHQFTCNLVFTTHSKWPLLIQLAKVWNLILSRSWQPKKLINRLICVKTQLPRQLTRSACFGMTEITMVAHPLSITEFGSRFLDKIISNCSAARLQPSQLLSLRWRQVLHMISMWRRVTWSATVPSPQLNPSWPLRCQTLPLACPTSKQWLNQLRLG